MYYTYNTGYMIIIIIKSTLKTGFWRLLYLYCKKVCI